MYKVTLASLAVLATLASAQLQGLPTCAQGCVGTSFGGCGPLDVNCICSNKSLIDGLACCVSTACGADDQKKTIDFANALCASSGVNNLPQSATCAAGTSATSSVASSGSATSRVTPVPEGSSTGSSASVTSSGAVSSASSAASSAAASVSSAVSSVVSSASSAAESKASAASSSATSAAGAASASASRAASSASSAAGAVVTKVGSAGLGLVVAGVLAAL